MPAVTAIDVVVDVVGVVLIIILVVVADIPILALVEFCCVIMLSGLVLPRDILY